MVTFTREAHDAIVRHAERGKPYEICGVLGGTRDPGGGADDGRDGDDRVATTVTVENISETPEVNYHMEPEDQLRAIDEVEDAGHDVVGFYHSHPEGPEQPSSTDEDRATWPDHVYVIVSLGPSEPFVGAWRWTGEAFEAEAVHVED
jgi:proteasome lid subunit RPN8/RPN11